MKISFKAYIIEVSNLFLIVLPVLLLTGYLDDYCIAMVSTALHEFGHIYAASLKSCRLKSIKATPAGFSASIDETNCRRQDLIFIYVCGPAVNILIAFLSLLMYHYISDNGQVLRNLFILNTCLAVFNLLPAIPLDGGKILLEALSGCFGVTTAGKFSTKAAFFLSVVFIALGLYQLFKSGGNFSLLIIGIFILISLTDGRMEAAFMNIKQILYRRSRLLKKGIYPARELVVLKRMHLGECVKYMDYDRIHMVHVLDDDMSEMTMLTESQIIEAMLVHTSDMSFEELVHILKGENH